MTNIIARQPNLLMGQSIVFISNSKFINKSARKLQSKTVEYVPRACVRVRFAFAYDRK